MSTPKKDFSTAESVAVWLAYEGMCVLCETPITDLRSLTIDHVLPERLQDAAEEFEAVRKLYNLPDDYDLNDFGNWVPAHPRCNSRKGKLILEGQQAMGMILARAKRKGEESRQIYARLKRGRRFASVLATLDSQIRANAPTIDQMVVLRALLDRAEEAAPPEAQLLVDPARWKVLRIRPWGLAEVTDGTLTGDTPTRTAAEDIRERWLCENCGNHGPFHIDVDTCVFTCLSCGDKSGGKHPPLD